MCIYIYIYMCMSCICICLCICTCIYIYIYTHISVHTHLCMCVYIYIYTYTYIHNRLELVGVLHEAQEAVLLDLHELLSLFVLWCLCYFLRHVCLCYGLVVCMFWLRVCMLLVSYRLVWCDVLFLVSGSS